LAQTQKEERKPRLSGSVTGTNPIQPTVFIHGSPALTGQKPGVEGLAKKPTEKVTVSDSFAVAMGTTA
jgi:hypothetical protein